MWCNVIRRLVNLQRTIRPSIHCQTESYTPWNFSWVVQEELAAMAVPETDANLRYLVEHGIKHLVTLSEDVAPENMANFPELQWHVIPVEEFEAPTMEQVKQFIDICQRSRAANEAVGVHCHWGRGRTGVMVAVYLIRFTGVSANEALGTVRRNRPGSVETREQELAVRDFYRDLYAQ